MLYYRIGFKKTMPQPMHSSHTPAIPLPEHEAWSARNPEYFWKKHRDTLRYLLGQDIFECLHCCLYCDYPYSKFKNRNEFYFEGQMDHFWHNHREMTTEVIGKFIPIINNFYSKSLRSGFAVREELRAKRLRLQK